jgi:DNA-binding NarL/FixJ family response regulator
MAESRARRRALLLETDPLVSERMRYLMRAEDFSVCAVDDWALFRTLAAQLPFEAVAVSDVFAEGAEALELLRKLDPLFVLVSSAESAAIARLRMAVPGAHLLDRALRDPDAVRRALGAHPAAREPEPQSGESERVGEIDGEWMQRAFGGFHLSERQLEVLSRALRGEPSREIAAALFISEPTVRNHLHAIYERLGVSGRRELLGRFVRGLTDDRGGRGS